MNGSPPGAQRYDLDPAFRRIQPIALMVGLAAAAASAAGLFLAGPEQFFRSYLVAFLFWGSVSLGALAMAMLHYLVGGNWGFLIRRGLEGGYKNLWLAALLFLPLILGLPYLYPWARPDLVAASPALQHKGPYLNIPFFIARAVLYFAVLILLARILTRWANDPRHWEDPVLRRRLQQLSAAGIMVYGLLMTFAAYDWIMSLEPDWSSTIFGMLVVTGQALGGMALGIAVLPRLAKHPWLADFTVPRHIRDLGALLLTLVIFWAYLAFSQYLIIWYGNLPGEATWYLERFSGGWVWLILLVAVVQFILPFAVLLSLRAKRNLGLIAGLSAAILAARWLDDYWQVMPAFYPQGFHLHWLDLTLPAAMGGLWIALFVRNLQRTPVPPLPQAGLQEVKEHGRKQTTA